MKRPANSFAFWPWSASRLHSAKEWLVLDLGHRTLKALQIAASREGIQSCKCEAVGLERDLSEPPLAERVASLVPPHSESAVALLLPEQMAISQVIDLPASSPEEVARRIDAETVAISGLSENVIVHDYARLDPIGEKRNPFWLTLCQESEILKQADRLQLRERIAEITTSANALIAAHRFQFHQASDRILIDIGATTTVIAIIRAGQGVFAGTVPVGADSFTEAIAREQNCSWEAAEDLKLSEQFLSGANSSAELIRALHSWQRQVESVVSEFDGSGLATHSILLCGGGSLLAGLTEYLKSTHWNASLWPNQGLPEGITPIWIPVFGMALQATGQNRQSISLLPEELQRIQIRQRRLQAVNSLNVFLMCVLLFAVSFVTVQKWNLWNRKSKLLEDSVTTLETVRRTQKFQAALDQDLRQVRPAFLAQIQTAESLAALQQLEQVRSNRSFWFVLFADQKSYFDTSMTNALTLTNQSIALSTNPPIRPGFIAEICIPEENERARQTLAQVVSELKLTGQFSNVDSISADRRRVLVDPKLLLPERHFAIELQSRPNPLSLTDGAADKSASPLESKPGRTFRQRTEARNSSILSPEGSFPK